MPSSTSPPPIVFLLKAMRYLIPILIVCILIPACRQIRLGPKVDVEATISNTEEYRYDTGISGDEEGASIITEPEHSMVSELIRDASTNFSVVYRYVPDSTYTGEDRVVIETCTGGLGRSCGTYGRIRFDLTITE